MANTKKKAAQESVVEAAVEAVAAPVEVASEPVKPKRTCKRKAAVAVDAEAPVAAEKPAKTAKPAPKRTATKKAAKPVEKVVVQIMGKDATPEDMVARAKADWEANGHSVADIQTLSVYLNAAEGMVYYVVNDDMNSGSFAF